MILKTKTQKGFSLLELLLVVAVGAILILAGLAIYRNITANTSVNDTSRMVNVLKQEVQRIYQGEASYAALDNDLLVDTQVVPAKHLGGADGITSPFKTDVTVEVNAGDAETFDIGIDAVPAEACLKLGLEYTTNDADFVNVSIDGNDVNVPTVANINAVCGDGVDMIWTFN